MGQVYAAENNGSKKEVGATPAKSKINSKLVQQFKEDEQVTFLVKLGEQVDTDTIAKKAEKTAQKQGLTVQSKKHFTRSTLLTELKVNATESQASLVDFLNLSKRNGSVSKFHSYYIVNALAVTGTKEVMEKIAAFAEVEKILPNEKRTLNDVQKDSAKNTVSEGDNSVEWNIKHIGAPAAWEMGIDGTGTVVASIDSGVQWDHPALKEKYRGYNSQTGEVDHQFSFFDAVNGKTEGYDDNGHGTHVTGTMVGSEPDGSNKIGVAPGAKWIAAKAFGGDGSGDDANILAAAEWIMAPGGRVDLAPDVVNNSWSGGSGKDEWFYEIIQTWRDYQIFPVFAAGNASLMNPGGPGSIAFPANYPISFAVGATNKYNDLADFSFQGPSPYGEIKPDITAPGVNIRSSVPGGVYEGGWDGTSMATPHVSATVALLRQVNANLTVDEIDEMLTKTAKPLTNLVYTKSPNNGFGNGLLNVYDAVLDATVGFGDITGDVSTEGEDTEPPTFEHTPLTEISEGVSVNLYVNVSDNVSVKSVQLSYKINDGEWKNVNAVRVSGDYLNGEYVAAIPEGVISAGTFVYKWTITDYGNHVVTSEEYPVNVLSGISIGYFTDFESNADGWVSLGENNSWEWGVPTSGPGKAASGEKVYATNLSGDYSNKMRAMLVMPPIQLPEGNAYLQFKQWYSFETSKYTGTAYDWGNVYVSTNGQDWTSLLMVSGESNGWVNTTVDLSAYSGQGIYIAFHALSDSSGTRPGWYIDDVGLTDIPGTAAAEAPKSQSASLSFNIKGPEAAASFTNKEEEAVVSTLPLKAQVSVLETGRSTVTSPADGSYRLFHPAGEYTVVAESYGYRTDSQKVSVSRDGAVDVNFTLEKLATGNVSGTITDEQSGEPVEGATVFLVEDANIKPIVTNANGEFSFAAYEGTYTLRVIASLYHTQDLTITVKGNSENAQNVVLKPFIGTTEELSYDDGTGERVNSMFTPGNGWAVHMSLAEGKEHALLNTAIFKFSGGNWPDPGSDKFQFEVFDASGTDGAPGKKIAGPFDGDAVRSDAEWTTIDLSTKGIEVDSDFYILFKVKDRFPFNPAILVDDNGPYSGRSWSYIDGKWRHLNKGEGNYMIRAVVNYPAGVPVVTSPVDGLYVTNAAYTVQGKADPDTEVHVYNNGEEAAVVTSNGAGEFSAELTLSEGENSLTARAALANGLTEPSKAITLVLDTTKPVVNILTPVEGTLLNTKSVTVTGQVEELNLASLQVNGVDATVENGVFAAAVELVEGENQISVAAVDLAGNVSTEGVSVTVDTTKPVVTILTPADGEKLNNKNTTVTGKVEELHLASLQVNGADVSVEDGTFEAAVDLVEGENKITVAAVDAAGNETTEVVTVHVDTAAPVIENVLPNKDVHLKKGEAFKIEFTSEPGLEAFYVISTSGETKASPIAMEEDVPGHYVGEYKAGDAIIDGAQIQVIAQDLHGNETSQFAEGLLFVNKAGGENPGDGEDPGNGEDPGTGQNPGQDPGNGQNPGQNPGDTKNPGIEKKPGTNDKSELPDTATNTGNILLIGFLLLAIGSILLFRNNRMQKGN